MNDLIERLRLGDGTSADHELLLEAADALEALAQPEQEPVVGCAECGANGNFALYCVTCAEKFVGGILKDNTSRQ